MRFEKYFYFKRDPRASSRDVNEFLSAYTKLVGGVHVGPLLGVGGGRAQLLGAHGRLQRVEHSRHCAVEQSEMEPSG